MSSSDRILLNLIGEFGLVDRYRFDHPGWEIWTWSLKWPPLRVASYVDIMLIRRVALDFLDCPTFHRLDYSNLRLVCARVVLGLEWLDTGNSICLYRIGGTSGNN